MILLLKCPKCGNEMKYMPSDKKSLANKSKRCVYCGKNFNVFQHIKKRVE